MVSDDLGVEHLSFYGIGEEGFADTPKLELWEDLWLQFYDAWSAPLCSPTRTIFHSGQHGFRNGVGKVVSSDTVWGLDTIGLAHLLPKLLKSHPTDPYTTAAFGKWHMGTSDGQCTDCVPDQGGDQAAIEAGYDRFAGLLLDKNGGPPSPYDIPYFHFWLTTATASNVLTTEIAPVADVYLTHEIVDWFIDWYDNDRPAGVPWLAYVAFPTPHTPLHCPPEGPQAPYASGTFDCTQGDPAQSVENYRGMIKALDIEIDRLLRHIAGLSGTDPVDNPDNTLIIFASDNGSDPAVATLPLDPTKAKCTVGQGGVRVPYLIGGDIGNGMVAAGEVGLAPDDERMVGIVDLYATILDVAGVALPTGVTLDSVSLVDHYFLGEPFPSDARDYLYTEVFGPNFDPDPATGEGPTLASEAIRNRQHKLVLKEETQQAAMYDLFVDPWEQTNVFSDGISSEEAAIRDELMAERATILGNQDLLDICTKVPTGDPCVEDADCCSKMCEDDGQGQVICVNPADICKQ